MNDNSQAGFLLKLPVDVLKALDKIRGERSRQSMIKQLLKDYLIDESKHSK